MHSVDKQVLGFTPSQGLAEEIAAYIQKQIVTGELKAGSKISEASITQDLRVSRGPVRESLRLLARRHLVDLQPRKGARVTPFDPQDVNHLYDLEKSLLDLLVRKVFDKWHQEDLVFFNSLLTSIGEAAGKGDPLELMDITFQFQRAACVIVGNHYLTSAITDLQPSFSRAYFRAMTSGQEELESITEFIAGLIENMVSRDLDQCLALVHRYTEHQRALVLSTFT